MTKPLNYTYFKGIKKHSLFEKLSGTGFGWHKKWLEEATQQCLA